MSFLLLHYSGVRSLTGFAGVDRWISTVALRVMGQMIDSTVSRTFLQTHITTWLLPMRSSHLTKSVTLTRSSRRSKTVLPASILESGFFFCLSSGCSFSLMISVFCLFLWMLCFIHSSVTENSWISSSLVAEISLNVNVAVF